MNDNKDNVADSVDDEGGSSGTFGNISIEEDASGPLAILRLVGLF